MESATAKKEARVALKVEGVGGGVYELKVDFGPGYRVYFGKDGPVQSTTASIVTASHGMSQPPCPFVARTRPGVMWTQRSGPAALAVA